MSKEITSPGKKVPLMHRSGGNKGCLILTLIGIFFGFVFVAGVTLHLEVVYNLAVGWIIFLLSNVAALEVNWEMTGCGIGALLIAIFGFHRFLVWVRKEKPWKWTWTLSVTTLMLMLFAASVSMTGIIHQMAWMTREPLTQSNNRLRLTHNMSNAKQMFLVLVEYDDDFGEMPESLRILKDEGYIGSLEGLMFHPARGRIPEPWMYFGAGRSWFEDLSDHEGYPILISPYPIRGSWVVLREDGSVILMKTGQLKKEYPWLVDRLPNLFKGEKTPN